MPAGAVPVPIDAVTGKREAGGYEFFYEEWKEDTRNDDSLEFAISTLTASQIHI